MQKLRVSGWDMFISLLDIMHDARYRLGIWRVIWRNNAWVCCFLYVHLSYFKHFSNNQCPWDRCTPSECLYTAHTSPTTWVILYLSHYLYTYVDLLTRGTQRWLLISFGLDVKWMSHWLQPGKACRDEEWGNLTWRAELLEVWAVRVLGPDLTPMAADTDTLLRAWSRASTVSVSYHSLSKRTAQWLGFYLFHKDCQKIKTHLLKFGFSAGLCSSGKHTEPGDSSCSCELCGLKRSPHFPGSSVK